MYIMVISDVMKGFPTGTSTKLSAALYINYRKCLK